jgi:Tfp pilus assembly major pilin PilA
MNDNFKRLCRPLPLGALTLTGLCLALPVSAIAHIDENIQDWTARNAYGSYTQSIDAGDVDMESCLVSPGASASGTGSVGRVQMQASNGILTLPAVNSVGTATFTLVAGAANRSITLQKRIGDGAWSNVTTFSGIGTTGATYFYDIDDSSDDISLRLSSPSHALYVHDIIVAPIVSLPIDEGFDDFDGVRPAGWKFVGLAGFDIFTDSGWYGADSPALRLDDSDEVWTPLYSSQSDVILTFWLRGQADQLTSTLVCEEYNSAWKTLTEIDGLPTTGTVKGPYDLDPDTRRVRFTYNQGFDEGDLAFDDVFIRVRPTPSVTPTPTPTPRPCAAVVWADWTSLAHRWCIDEGDGLIAYDSVGALDGVFESKMDESNWAEGTSIWGSSSVRFTSQTDQYIDCGGAVSWDTNFTVFFWVWPVTRTGEEETYVANWTSWEGAWNYGPWRMRRRSWGDGVARLNVKDEDGADNHLPTSTNNIIDGQWNFYALVWNVTDGIIWINDTETSFDLGGKEMQSYNSPITFGGRIGNYSGDCYLDEVAIFDRALTDEEIGWIRGNKITTPTPTPSVTPTPTVTPSPTPKPGGRRIFTIW